MNETNRDSVEFGDKSSAGPGAISGAAIAVGVPAVTLIWGHALAPSVQMVVVIVGVAVGGLISLTATFFSLVIPSSVKGYGGPGGNCSCGKCNDESERNARAAEKLL